MLLKSALNAVLVISFIGLIPGAVSAEPPLYNCNGVFRNLPCDQAAATPAEKSPEEVQQKAERSERRSLIHGLTMSQLKARQDYDINVDIGSAEDVCEKPDSVIQTCRAEVERLQGVIGERVAAQKLVEEKERSNKLKEEANQLQAEQNEIEANKPNIAVIQNNYPRGYPRRRNPHTLPVEQESGVNIGVEIK